MKNTQKGSATLLLVILMLIGIGAGSYYFYTTQKAKLDIGNVATPTNVQGTSTVSSSTEVQTVSKVTLTDKDFLAVVEDPQGRILARGDIDLDGTEDVIILNIQCGASCGVSLFPVLNKNGKAVRINSPEENFAPAFYGSSAAKSEVPDVTIKNGIITLTGPGLDCMKSTTKEDDICTEEKWRIAKSVTYKFDGKNIVQLSVTPLSVADQLKITKGTYRFSEFTQGVGSNQSWYYQLNIKQDGGLGLSGLNIDGFQTAIVMNVNGVTSGNNVDFIFDSYGEGNMGGRYEKGEVLFTVKPTVAGLSIEWKKMEPFLTTSIKGSVFKK